jgi:hypothetical protein
MNKNTHLAFLSLTAGFLAGCAATPEPGAKASPPPPAAGVSTAQSISPDGIVKGMTAAEVLARWGQPVEKRPLSTSAGDAEVWVYRRIIGTYQRQVATATRMVPVFDPLTGGTKEVPEAVYSQEVVSTFRVSELLIFRDRLIEWHVSQETKKKLE